MLLLSKCFNFELNALLLDWCLIRLIVGCCACYQLPDATPEQIKKAYYNCMKACHPDLSGDDPETTNFCMFINEVYAVGSHLNLSDYITI